MIKKISLALFTLRYASVSLVIFGMKINHHGLEHHDDQGMTHIVSIVEDSSCGEKDTSCMNCGDEGGEGCCDNETTCFVKCSKGVGIYAYTNPKDENEQIHGDIHTPSLPRFVADSKLYEYTIIGYKKKTLFIKFLKLLIIVSE